QIGEPCRHYQIIGGEFQAHLARLLDEGEVLIGQRENGNFSEIDLLLTRQREQKIERAFKALDVHHQRRLVGGAFGQFRFELLFSIHANPASGRMPCSSFASSARLTAISIAAGGLRAASAAPARRAASPASAGVCAATSSISDKTPLQ